MARKPTIGAGIALDGEKEFRRAVSEINKDIEILASEMGKVTAEFEGNANSLAALTAKQDVLGRQMLNQSEKVDKLRAALKNSANEYGEADKRTKNWQIQLNKAEAALAKTKSELDKTTKEIDKFSKSADNAGKSTSFLADVFTGGFLANLASDALRSGVQSLEQFAAAAFDLSDELMQVSDITGRTVEELQKLKYIGDDVGVSLDTITSAQARLTRSLGMAQDGAEKQASAFAQLGVHYLNADGSLRNATTVMYEAFDALGKVANETERDALAMELFGRSATELNPLIKAGSDELKRLGDEAKNAGAVMSEEAVQGLDALGDAFDHVKQQAVALVGEFIGGLIPNIKTVGDLNANIAKNEEVSTLIDRYRTLKDRLNDNTLSSDELRAVSEELATVKQKLIELSDGMISAYAEETGVLDQQIENYAKLTEAEKRLVEAQLINKAAGYDELLLKRDELLKKNTAATSELTAAQLKYTEEQTKLNKMIRDGATQEAIGFQALKVESLKLAIQGIPGVMSGLEDMAGKIETEFSKTNTAVDEAGAAIKGLFEIGWSTREIADNLGISLGGVYNVMNDVADVTERATSQMQAFATAAKNANVSLSPGTPTSGGPNYTAGSAPNYGGGQPIVVNVNPSPVNMDGRTVAQITYDYSIEEGYLRGNSSFGQR